MNESLIVVPTPLERDRWIADLRIDADRIHVIGFGPVAAAARTAHRLAVERPSSVLLVGIAGTYDPQTLAVGHATQFDRVVLAEIGAGRGPDRIHLEELGFGQIETESETIHDRLDLTSGAPRPATASSPPVLLTVLSASGDALHADERRRAYPDAVAEDMETFGVALACWGAGIPLKVIRGISNVAGDRNHERWRIDDAMSAVTELVLTTLG